MMKNAAEIVYIVVQKGPKRLTGQERARLEKDYLHSAWNSDTNILMADGKGGYLSA